MKHAMKNSLTKALSLVMVLILLTCSLSACGDAKDGDKETTPSVNVGNTPEKPENNDGGESNGEKDNEEEHDFTRVFTLDSLEPLSKEKQAEVEAAWTVFENGAKLWWCGKYLSNGKIDALHRYYGTYNDCVVIFCTGSQWLRGDGGLVIAGQEIRYTSVFGINAYKGGEFVSIKDAYEIGWLTDDDITEIVKYHNAFVDYLYAGKPSDDSENNNVGENDEKNNGSEHDFTRVFTLDSLKPLSAERQAEIEAAWEEMSGEKLSWCGEYLSDGKIDGYDRYYGTFNDCVVVFTSRPPRDMSSTLHLVVAGQKIYSLARFWIYVYKGRGGEPISINTAYSIGWLTDDDITEIVKYHNDFEKYLQN